MTAREPNWTPEEQAEVDRVEAGRPSPPSRELRYILTDCFVCGVVTVRRVGQPTPSACPNCGRPVMPVIVAQRPSYRGRP